MISEKKCIPCQGGIPPLNEIEINKFIKELDSEWQVHQFKELRKEFEFQTYQSAISFSNKIAELAEIEGHHPFIHINFKKVVIILFTHKIDGLHKNDFILASKCDEIFKTI